MKTMVGYHYLRTLRADTARVHEQIRKEHAKHPEYNHKELSMVCFVGENVVQRALSQSN